MAALPFQAHANYGNMSINFSPTVQSEKYEKTVVEREKREIREKERRKKKREKERKEDIKVEKRKD